MKEKQKKEFIAEKVQEENDGESSSDDDSIMNEDEYSKARRSSSSKAATKEESESLTSPDNVSASVSEDGTKPELLKIALKEKQRGTIDAWWL